METKLTKNPSRDELANLTKKIFLLVELSGRQLSDEAIEFWVRELMPFVGDALMVVLHDACRKAAPGRMPSVDDIVERYNALPGARQADHMRKAQELEEYYARQRDAVEQRNREEDARLLASGGAA